jgi:hypothetical protein
MQILGQCLHFYIYSIVNLFQLLFVVYIAKVELFTLCELHNFKF